MNITFRTKLIVLMTLVVAGVTGATLYLTQQQVQGTYQRLFEAQFRSQISYFTDEQHKLQQAVADSCKAAIAKESFLSALREHRAPSVFEQVVTDIVTALEPLLRKAGTSKVDDPRQRMASQPFIALTNGQGQIIATNRARPAGAAPATSSRAPGIGDRLRWFQDKAVGDVLQKQAVGYLVVPLPTGGEQAREGLLTPVFLPDRGVVGALFVGYPLPDISERALMDFSRQTDQGEALSGVWLEGAIHSSTIPEAARADLAALLKHAADRPSADGGDLVMRVNGEPHRVFHTLLNPDSPLPQAEQVCLYSLKMAELEKTGLRWKIGGFGLISLLAAILLIFAVSQHLTGPLRELLRGTEMIRSGHYDVRLPVRSRDEVGEVTASFNEMAEGLAMTERFRTVLDLVADKDVAAEMIAGRIALGGETRDVTVLFCDVRGFTAWSRTLPAEEVVRWLNQHMTALPRIVYDHGGIVDKFIGDAVMAVFGAPKSNGSDAHHAVACALRMLDQRMLLNATTDCHLEVGIGIASGSVLAGNMGAENRLNYTVTGECVNLASRLSDKAARMEALIDDATRKILDDDAASTSVGEMEIKGYASPVTAYRLNPLAAPMAC